VSSHPISRPIRLISPVVPGTVSLTRRLAKTSRLARHPGRFSVRLRRLPVTIVLIGSFLAATAGSAQQPASRWEDAVLAYENADRAAFPSRGEIVFVGSSSIRRWDVASSFPDLKIINRGIPGTELGDAVRFVERIVLPYEPRVVVVYAGDNDINNGRTSEQVAVEFERFVAKVHARLPQTRIVFVGIKPSPLRWTQVDRMRSANTMVRAFAERDDRIGFIDVDQVMLGWDERPRRELYVEDGLHLSAEGYRIWTMLVRPYLTPSADLSTDTR
jgi:lysophospholipase L1-like esterase